MPTDFMLLFAKMDKMTTILIEQSKGVQLAKTILEEENKANPHFFDFSLTTNLSV